MTELGRAGDVQEIEVTAADIVGKSIDDLDAALPEGVIIALVGRDGETQMPEPEFKLQRGDHLTFIGRKRRSGLPSSSATPTHRRRDRSCCRYFQVTLGESSMPSRFRRNDRTASRVRLQPERCRLS